MWYAISRTTRHDIECINIHVLCNLYTMSVVRRPLHVQLASCSSKDGRNLLVVHLDGAALSPKRIDEYLDPLSPLRRSVCAI